MRTVSVVGLAHLLSLAGMPHEEATDVALRLAAEEYYATRGVVDGPASAVTEAALQAAGMPEVDAHAIATALGQQGYWITERGRRRARDQY